MAIIFSESFCRRYQACFLACREREKRLNAFAGINASSNCGSATLFVADKQESIDDADCAC